MKVSLKTCRSSICRRSCKNVLMAKRSNETFLRMQQNSIWRTSSKGAPTSSSQKHSPRKGAVSENWSSNATLSQSTWHSDFPRSFTASCCSSLRHCRCGADWFQSKRSEQAIRQSVLSSRRSPKLVKKSSTLHTMVLTIQPKKEPVMWEPK